MIESTERWNPKSIDPARPRDVICRLHRYKQKEVVLRKAWEYETLEFDGAEVKILPDLSRATPQRRAMLRPLLDVARRLNVIYRWGFPLLATFRKEQRSFTLRNPGDLPALFTFLDSDPVPIPNWLMFLPWPVGRASSGVAWRAGQSRPQRSRRRYRLQSQDESRES